MSIRDIGADDIDKRSGVDISFLLIYLSVTVYPIFFGYQLISIGTMTCRSLIMLSVSLDRCEIL